MDLLQTIVLGIVQGLTEFLPISSSAHLVLVPFFFSWRDPGLAYDVALHMGTLVAILAYFWRDWLMILKQVFGGNFRLASCIVLGSVPAAVVGLALEKHAEETFRSPILIAVTLAAFGLILYYWDRRGRKDRELQTFALADALAVGAAQALAIIPGVSRSGVTITACLMLGLTRASAARFSFLLGAPITAGAGLIKAKHIMAAVSGGGEMAMAVGVGFAASLFSGLAALGLLTYIVRSRTFNVFVGYRLLLSLIIVVVVVIIR